MSDQDGYDRYSMILEWEPQGAVYVVTVPELPGCRTHGKTLAEAVRRGLEATEGWIESARGWGEPVPPPRHFVLDPVEDSASTGEDGVDVDPQGGDGPEEFSDATRGDHNFWRHSLLPGEYVTILGDEDDDALPYQEQEVRRMLAKVRRLSRSATG